MSQETITSGFVSPEHGIMENGVTKSCPWVEIAKLSLRFPSGNYQSLSEKMEGAQEISKNSLRTHSVCNSLHGCLVLTIITLTILCLCVGPAISKETDAEEDACSFTPFPDECLFSIKAYRIRAKNNTKQGTFLRSLLKSSLSAVQDFKRFCNHSMDALSNPEHACVRNALSTCQHLLESAEDCVDSSLSHLELLMMQPANSTLGLGDDILAWLSASSTYHTTCIEADGHCTLSPAMENLIVDHANVSLVRAINSISLASTLVPEMTSSDQQGLLVSSHDSYDRDENDESNNATACDICVVVAKDGSGNYSSIQEAVKQVPSKKNYASYTIRIKQGVYNERVTVPDSALNVIFLGEGINKTIVTGNRSAKYDSINTYRTCILCIDGNGFIAKDMTFQNTAGAKGYQAVAVRVDSDKSAFYRCSFEGYQDTLYLQTMRQFYRDCTIYGTVDFVFGNAAAVFQRCDLILRRPLIAQSNAVTAHARSSASQTTGFGFKDCKVFGSPELQEIVFGPYNNTIQSYLGRPWGMYSRTVFLRTYLGPSIDPAGWVAWNGTDFALGTVYYAEYENFGPGGNFTHRVRWDINLTDPNVGAQFSIPFISGETWLPKTGIPFDDDV